METIKINMTGWECAGYRTIVHPVYGAANVTEEEYMELKNRELEIINKK